MKFRTFSSLLLALLALVSVPSVLQAGAFVWDGVDMIDRNAGDGSATRYFVLHTDVDVPAVKMSDFKAAVVSGDVGGALLALIPPAGVTLTVPPNFHDLIQAIARSTPLTGADVRCTIALKAGSLSGSASTTKADFRVYLRISTQASGGTTTQTATSSLDPDALHAKLDSTAFGSAISTLQGQVTAWLSASAPEVATALNDALATLPTP